MNENSFKILIIKNDDIMRETYAQIFRQKGAEVQTAKDGLEGLDMATKEIPDVILTGIVLSRMDGFKLVQALKENVETSKIPIMILSHLGREEDRQKAIELRIETFIVQGTMTPNEIVDRAKNLTRAGDRFKLSFDSNDYDAPRLANTLTTRNFACPKCSEKIVIEITSKKGNGGYEAYLKCPKCDYSV